MDIEIRPVKNDSEYRQILGIRKEVFVKGQGVPEDIEVDEYETSFIHIICFCEGQPAGCARIRKVGKKLKFERIAVLDEFRGKGVGKEIVKYMLAYTLDKSMLAYMNTQYYLLDFYSSLGFRPEGEVFYEAGIKHIKMVQDSGK